MDLFAVNRFLEEEAPKQSAEILDQLRLQARKRKELRDKRKDKEGKSLDKVGNDVLAETPGRVKATVKKKQKIKGGKAKSEAAAKIDRNEDELLVGKSAASKRKKIAMLSDDDYKGDVKRSRTETGTKLNEKPKKQVKKKKKKKKKLEAQVKVDPEVNEEQNELDEIDEEEVGVGEGFTVIGEVIDEKRGKVRRVIPDWLAKPKIISIDLQKNLTKVSELSGLHPSLVSLLESNGVRHLFPVQSAVIPHLLKTAGNSWLRPKDVCVSAPTGSGKTLAYALPIIQVLYGRIVCSVKALVVLPVIDLATQVYKVFKTYCKGSGLQIGLAVGQSNLSAEQASLVRKGYRRYHSLVDILICTPGRLVDHINHTPGFSLKDLRFLVIDEADRMMQQIKQGWLSHVEKSFYESNENLAAIPLTAASMEKLRSLPQKLLFSATLSRNPEKLQELKLFQPQLFTSVVGVDKLEDYKVFPEAAVEGFVGKYTTPKELTECYVTCNASMKPLVLLHFICNLKYRRILCFTNSVESSRRLHLLLSAFGSVNVREFSSNLNIRQRGKILKQFSQGLVDMIVCSDAMARGIDVENVEYVISYDKPPYLKTYIHRVGRTARAGRQGTAISFLQSYEVANFQSMMTTAKKTQMLPLTVDQSDLEPMEEKFQVALSKVAEIVAEKAAKSANIRRHQ